jgi:hypothetical protein
MNARDTCGIIELRGRITRDMLRSEPETLFVFGDNLAGRGLGGQAREMRGEPNAIGIPTKHAPSRHPSAFFDDSDLTTFKLIAGGRFTRLAEHLRAGGKVVWPADGIGTGLAELERKAPAIWATLERWRAALSDLAVSPLSQSDQRFLQTRDRGEGI